MSIAEWNRSCRLSNFAKAFERISIRPGRCPHHVHSSLRLLKQWNQFDAVTWCHDQACVTPFEIQMSITVKKRFWTHFDLMMASPSNAWSWLDTLSEATDCDWLNNRLQPQTHWVTNLPPWQWLYSVSHLLQVPPGLNLFLIPGQVYKVFLVCVIWFESLLPPQSLLWPELQCHSKNIQTIRYMHNYLSIGEPAWIQQLLLLCNCLHLLPILFSTVLLDWSLSSQSLNKACMHCEHVSALL